MKSLITFIALFLFLTNGTIGQDTDNDTGLWVTVENIKSAKGNIFVGLYDSEGNWLSKTLKGEVCKIVDGKAKVQFKDIEPGIYGISIYHDENDNGKLDAGIFGIPKEPYACSKGAKGRFGPPKWSDAKFKYDGITLTQTITL